MKRRSLINAAPLLMLGAALPACAADDGIAAEWAVFRSRFLQPDGRIVDTGNGGISHSEGQGWGLLFAESAGDKTSFDLIFAWTSTHLARPGDALHIWRYDPAAANPVSDPNNATDGDIFIAWALARGAVRWAEPNLAIAAAAIATDILAKVCIMQSGRSLLLPSANGFVTPHAITLNLSYYVMPAFASLAALVPSPLWTQLVTDGLYVMNKGVFGQWSLPPDWLNVSRPELTLSPAPAWPPRFSYDAIRIPLWLTWAGMMPGALSAAFTAYFQSSALPYRPAWVDLTTGAYANYPAPSGMLAVADLTLGQVPVTALPTAAQAALPTVSQAADYYSAALTLLARIARAEMM